MGVCRMPRRQTSDDGDAPQVHPILLKFFQGGIGKMKNPSSYLKMRVLGAIESAPGKTQGERVRNVAQMVFIDEEGCKRMYTWTTIYTWLYRYKHKGITGSLAKSKERQGSNPEDQARGTHGAINQGTAPLPQRPLQQTDIVSESHRTWALRREECAPTTYYRFLREYDLLKTRRKTKKRMAFRDAARQSLWQADTMFGPYLREVEVARFRPNSSLFIDDASRVICHGEFFLQENIDTMIAALRLAMYKRGVPSNCMSITAPFIPRKNSRLSALGSALFCVIRRCATGFQGKIERFFRTVRETFLARNLDLSSLAALNRQFTAWVEDEYKPQRTLSHRHETHRPLWPRPKPHPFIFLISKPTTNFSTAKTKETVLSNNTFSFRAVTYEAPCNTSRKKNTDPFRAGSKDTPVIVYHKTNGSERPSPSIFIANGQMRNRNQGETHDQVVFRLSKNPFSLDDITLMSHQQGVFDILNVHSQQGGLCLLMGEPGTGKSVIKEAIRNTRTSAWSSSPWLALFTLTTTR